MPHQPTLAEKVFVVLTLFLSTAALIPILLEREGTSGIAPDPITPLMFMGVYAVTTGLILWRSQSFYQVITKNIWLWLLAFIALASIGWTIDPETTTRRAILIFGTTAFGAYMAVRFSIREQLQLLAWALGLVISLSVVFAIALPSYGTMTFQEGGIHAGSWRGIMTHKNMLGRLMVLSGMTFLFVALGKPQRAIYRQLAWGGLGLSVALLLLSTSKTALIAFVSLMLILLLYRSWRLSYNLAIPLLILVILVVGSSATLVVDNLPAIAGAIGRDLTFTGRTDIWSAMLDKISERPWTGYGFNAFWRDWDNEATAYMWRYLAWECPYGHNGFMDLLAELGIIGLGAFILSYCSGVWESIRLLRITRSIEGLWAITYLTFLLIYNVSESTLMATNSIYWIVYSSTTFTTICDRQYLEAAQIQQLYDPEQDQEDDPEWQVG